jgi:hypothetical protein
LRYNGDQVGIFFHGKWLPRCVAAVDDALGSTVYVGDFGKEDGGREKQVVGTLEAFYRKEWISLTAY